jgi:hypothetical protein
MDIVVDIQAHTFSGQHKRRQYHASVQARQRVAAINPLFNRDFV